MKTPNFSYEAPNSGISVWIVVLFIAFMLFVAVAVGVSMRGGCPWDIHSCLSPFGL